MSAEARRVLLTKAIAEVVPDRYPELRQDVRRYVLPLIGTFEREVRDDEQHATATYLGKFFAEQDAKRAVAVVHKQKCAGPLWRQERSRYECACGNAWTAQPLDEDAARASGEHRWLGADDNDEAMQHDATEHTP